MISPSFSSSSVSAVPPLVDSSSSIRVSGLRMASLPACPGGQFFRDVFTICKGKKTKITERWHYIFLNLNKTWQQNTSQGKKKKIVTRKSMTHSPKKKSHMTHLSLLHHDQAPPTSKPFQKGFDQDVVMSPNRWLGLVVVGNCWNWKQ